MLTYREVVNTLRGLGLDPQRRLLALVRLEALGPLPGGAETFVGALLSVCELLLTPAFTPQCLVVPEIGPDDNGLAYGGEAEHNAAAEIFQGGLPAAGAQGELANALLRGGKGQRSPHPLLSFVGVNAAEALAAQSLAEPLAPLAWLAEYDADILLVGCDHSWDVGLHYAEQIAGRKSFVRWALTDQGVVECPSVPGCADGFQAIASRLSGVARSGELGEARIEVVPLRDLVHLASGWIREDPRALLCDRPDCARCRAVRAAVRA
jgi:aminoglycoside 3-N-acetyltransferase